MQFKSRMILIPALDPNFSKSSKKLFEKDIIYTFPILEISLLFIQIYVYFRNLISKPTLGKATSKLRGRFLKMSSF